MKMVFIIHVVQTNSNCAFFKESWKSLADKVKRLPKVWAKKPRTLPKVDHYKKSTIFVQSLWNLVKIITLWGNHFHQVSWGLDKNCGFFTNGQFLSVSGFFYSDFTNFLTRPSCAEPRSSTTGCSISFGPHIWVPRAHHIDIFNIFDRVCQKVNFLVINLM